MATLEALSGRSRVDTRIVVGIALVPVLKLALGGIGFAAARRHQVAVRAFQHDQPRDSALLRGRARRLRLASRSIRC